MLPQLCQIKSALDRLSAAKAMEQKYGGLIGDPSSGLATVQRLMNPETAIMYMAAFIHDLDATTLTSVGNQGKLNHQAAIYNVDPREYVKSQLANPGTLGPTASSYWANVSNFIDQAKALNVYCGSGGAGCHEATSIGPYGPYP